MALYPSPGIGGTITGWRIGGTPVSGQTCGSCYVDVLFAPDGSTYWTPYATNTIIGSTAIKPGITNGIDNSGTNFTGWTSGFLAKGRFGWEIEEVTNFSLLNLHLDILS